MVKSALSFLIVLFWGSTHCLSQDNILKIPLSLEKGYGPLRGGFGRVSQSDSNNKENTWHTTYLPVKGFPEQWKNFRYGMLQTDFFQWTYQNYKQGKLTNDDYLDLQKSWKWTPDEKNLSAEPIKCYVHCAWNIDENGHMGEVILDANNNLDFSDDTIFNIPVLQQFSFDDVAKNKRYFKAQQFKNGKITDITLPVALTISAPYVFYSIPIYGKAVLKEGKSSYKFAVTSSNFGRTDFSNAQMYRVKNYRKKVAVYDLPLNKGEYITLGNDTYEYLGVDVQYMTLNLKAINDSVPLYSAQTGYYAFPFTDKELVSGEDISLEKYKGKYVFIDFWGTWCTPCVQEIPNIKKAYKALDTNKIAFLSIAYDSPERVKEFIAKEKIEWPQIVNTSANDAIIKVYNIDSYPTTLLINPEGKIIAKNLRGDKLDKKLKKLIR
jgi:thiol-disulfide isomerase/thioredoxin